MNSENIEHKKALLLHPMFLSGAEIKNWLEPLKDDYFFIAPDLSAHGEDKEIFLSAEKEAEKIKKNLLDNGYKKIDLLLGFSIGARVALELIKDEDVVFKTIVLDGLPIPKYGKKSSSLFFLSSRLSSFLLSLAKRNQGAAEKILLKKDIPSAKIMGDTFERIDKHSVRNIMWAATHFEFHNYSKDLQQRITIMYGGKELNRFFSKTITKHYPFITIQKHKGYNHCEFVIKNRGEYVERIRELEVIKNDL